MNVLETNSQTVPSKNLRVTERASGPGEKADLELTPHLFLLDYVLTPLRDLALPVVPFF